MYTTLHALIPLVYALDGLPLLVYSLDGLTPRKDTLVYVLDGLTSLEYTLGGLTPLINSSVLFILHLCISAYVIPLHICRCINISV